MNKLDERIQSEVASLVETGARILRQAQSSDCRIAGDELAEVSMWVTRLGQLIRKLYGESSQHFQSYSTALCTKDFYSLHSQWNAHFSQMVGVAKTIEHDLAQGLLLDMRALISAEVLKDFIEQSEVLLAAGYHVPAASLAGAVLEDTLRKLCDRHTIPIPASTKIDSLNAELARAGVYDKLVQKRITALADVRNNADHGRFDKFQKSDVEDMVKWVRSFAADYLK